MGISEATKKKLEDNLNKALEKETAESFNEFLDEQKPADDIGRKYIPCYNMSFEEAQEYINNRGFDIPWTDCDVFVDFRYVTQTVANILRWADNNPKQNPAWSEEDEKILNLIIARLHSHKNVEAEEYGKDYHWLKSLRPQKQWKPSDEQMQALKDALNDAIMQYDFKSSSIKEEVTRKYTETIESLYNDLLKLRGE